MSHPPKHDGMHWDTAEIRREREFGWFRQHEAELIEEARRRRAEAERERERASPRAAEAPAARMCPRCSAPMRPDTIDGIEVEKCPTCEGIFFDRGELEAVLLKHDAHRRGFFRKLLGFHEE